MSKVVKTVFGGGDKPKPVPMPVIAQPKVMPLPDDANIERKKRDMLQRQQARGGRQSTILSDDDKLGG